MRKELLGFIKSFKHAFRGIGFVLRGRCIRVQLVIAILVLIAGLYFSLSTEEWFIIILTIFIVLVVETLNTAVEEVCNVIKDLPGVERMATKEARDVAAGSSLTISICAFIIGLIIFLPKILTLL